MAQPTSYTPAADFSDDELANVGGRSTVRTAALDAEFAALETTLGGVLTNLALNQRDDGEIRDARVRLHTLASDVRALLATGNATPRGDWVTATDYAFRDLVSANTNTYLCAIPHTSGTFATDLAADKWLLIALGSAIAASSVAFTPTATIAATTVQAAIEECDTENRALSAAAYADALAIMADTSNVSNADARLGVKLSAIGAAARTQHEVNAQTVWITDFVGADATGATGNDAAYASALAYFALIGSGVLYFPYGAFKFTASITLPTKITLQGQGYNATTLKRAFTGDFITSCGALSQLRDLAIDGDTATHGAGRGVLYPTGSYGCIHFGVNIYNFVEACVEFGNDGGSTFKAFGSYYFTTSLVAAAIKMGTDTGSQPKHFYGCESSGCILYDFGACNNVFIFGGYVGGVIFGASSNKVLMHGCRIGNAIPNVVISGQSHELVGCAFGNAGTFTLDATTTSVAITSCEISGWAVTDNGTGNSVYLGGSVAYTPTWAGSSAAPDIGTGAGKDGVVTGLYTRQGNIISGYIELTLSTDAGAGTGLWTFSLPRADYSSYVQQCGSGMSQSTGTSRLLVSRVEPGTGNVQVFFQNGTALTQLGSAASVWASGDIVRFNFSYMTR